jgi:hypothetical protein
MYGRSSNVFFINNERPIKISILLVSLSFLYIIILMSKNRV